MAALDTFESYVRIFSPTEQEALKDSIRETRRDLFAARSEDARLRLVEYFIGELQEKRAQSKRA